MIRRRMHVRPGHEPAFALIRQTDHARLAADLARNLGTLPYESPQPPELFLHAVALHDAGWDSHDDAPTLSSQGYPRDVFEMPRQLALELWSAAPDAAAPHGPWTQLLISLHILGLSAHMVANLPASPDDLTPHERFALNRFQHREIERQDHLRQLLRLSVDLPRYVGLVDPNTSPDEDRLRHQLRWLQAMDVLSLAICCTSIPVSTAEIHPAPGSPPENLHFHRDGNDVVVKPWPFRVPFLNLSIPARLIPARTYSHATELLDSLRFSEVSDLQSTVKPH
jgi:hypothetical protein